jgi:RNA polymerase sigma factor (sigma-70 family)
MRTRDTGVLRQVHRLVRLGTTSGMSDVQLLERFATARDEFAEQAFEALIERHGPMVFRVCRGVLGNDHTAEDAFQATFLVLARKARSLYVTGSLASWLYGVAHRVARRARSDAARRARHERRSAEVTRAGNHEMPSWRDDLSIVGDEIERLPADLRDVVVLCYLEGKTYDEAAFGLGVADSTVRGRLARARRRLRARLIRRGFTLSVELLLVQASCRPARAACSGPLVDRTVHAAIGVAAGKTAAAALVSMSVATLTEGVLSTMLLTKLKTAAVLVSIAVAVCGTGVLARQASGWGGDDSKAPGGHAARLDNGDAQSEQPGWNDDAVAQRAPTTSPAGSSLFSDGPKFPAIAAHVNGVAITRDELAEFCLARHGAKDLETLTTLALIEHACRDRGITIGQGHLQREFSAMAARVHMSPAAFLTMLEKERGMTREVYFRDVIYPRTALRKLGAETDEEQQKLYETLKRDGQIQIHLPKATKDLTRPVSTSPTDRDRRLDELEQKVDVILDTLRDLKGTTPKK